MVRLEEKKLGTKTESKELSCFMDRRREMERRKKGQGEEIKERRKLRESFNDKEERANGGQDEIEEGDKERWERDGKDLAFLFSLWNSDQDKENPKKPT